MQAENVGASCNVATDVEPCKPKSRSCGAQPNFAHAKVAGPAGIVRECERIARNRSGDINRGIGVYRVEHVVDGHGGTQVDFGRSPTAVGNANEARCYASASVEFVKANPSVDVAAHSDAERTAVELRGHIAKATRYDLMRSGFLQRSERVATRSGWRAIARNDRE